MPGMKLTVTIFAMTPQASLYCWWDSTCNFSSRLNTGFFRTRFTGTFSFRCAAWPERSVERERHPQKTSGRAAAIF
jgi:hypothetical protein